MRRFAFLSVLLGLVGALALVLGAAPRLAAQDSTPPGGELTQIELAPGFVAAVLAGAPSDRAPGQTVYLARFIIQPGSEIFPHGHPGTTVLAIESGSLGWTLLQGTAYVVRGAGSGGTAVEEIAAPETEVILEPGDAIYYEADVVHTARGASADEPTVVLGTLILGAGQPLLMTPEQMMQMEMGGTPAA
jgi:quercetin dioxygenase-like cupin family protein